MTRMPGERPLAEFVVLKFQPWGDAILLISRAWILLDDLPAAQPPVEVWRFPTFATAASAVAAWPDDGCTGVVPARIVCEVPEAEPCS